MSKKVKQVASLTTDSTTKKHGVSAIVIVLALIIILAGVGVLFYQFHITFSMLENHSAPAGSVPQKPSTEVTKTDSCSECKCENSITKPTASAVEPGNYKTIFLTKQIAERIDNTSDYSDKLESLKPLLNGQYVDEVRELDANKAMKILSFDEMIKVVETTAVPYKIAPEEKPAEAKSAEVKPEEKEGPSPLKGLFKVSKADDWKVKCNPILIDKAIQALRERNEWDALQVLEQFEPKNDDIKKVLDNLTLRNTLKYYLETIGNEVLKNG